MVCAPFRLSLEGRSLVNRNRPYACRGQLERISVPFLFVASPNRRSRLRPDLFHDPGFEKLDYRLLGVAALRTCRRNWAMIVAPRRSAQQHKLRVVEFDRHDLNARVSGAGQSRPLTDASPGSQRLSGRRVRTQRIGAWGRPHTCSFSDRKPVLSWSASAVIKEIVSGIPRR
jgi:hypothetical protein